MTAPSIRVGRLGASGALLIAALTLSGCSIVSSLTGGPPEGELDAFAISVGDCLNDAQVDEQITTVPFVDCSKPHDSEVFARTEVTGDVFPGSGELETDLAAFCRGDAFTQFIGIEFADSMYNTSGYYPSEASWQKGDRELLCTVWDPDAQVTGSLAGIKG